MNPNRILELAQAPTKGEMASFRARMGRQTQLARGQNLQMMDFAELGRPSLRAHVLAPGLAKAFASGRMFAFALAWAPGLGWAALAAVAAAVAIKLAI